MTDKPLADIEEDDLLENEDGDDVSGIRLRAVPEDGLRRRWYALHAHSGQEANVQNMLIAAAEQEGLSDLISNVLVPMEENTDLRPGTKASASRKSYPG